MWAGECFFWYRPTRVVPDKRPLNGCCCYLFMPFFHELTYRSDPFMDFHAWWLKRHRLAQGCAFWQFRWYCSSFWGWNPPKTQFLDVNRRFQSKWAKYWKFRVIETTALILTKFGTTIETAKWSSWVVLIGAQQIQDGRRLPFWKPLIHHMSSTFWPILIKFGMLMHVGLQRLT